MPDGRRFALFSRQQAKKFVLRPANNVQSTTAVAAFAEEIGQPVLPAQHTEPKTPDKYDRERRRDSITGTTYVALLKSTSGILFVEETPEKAMPASASAEEIRFEDYDSLTQLTQQNPRFFEELTQEVFSFKVTAKTIQQRVGVRRGRTQNDVMGESAVERLESIGASLPRKSNRGEAVHWAHRQGWSLGGAQVHFNLDLGTSGSNYSTLLWFEAPLKNLMRYEGITEVQVQGTVYMHPSNEIPVKIQYEFTWGNGRKLVGCTYPIETRWPTVAEYRASCAFFRLTRTPQQKTVSREEEKDLDFRQPELSSDRGLNAP